MPPPKILLCANMGWPTMSPMAKMCGTLVRNWMLTLMKPRSVTATPALSAAIFLPLGVRPTAYCAVLALCSQLSQGRPCAQTGLVAPHAKVSAKTAGSVEKWGVVRIDFSFVFIGGLGAGQAIVAAAPAARWR